MTCRRDYSRDSWSGRLLSFLSYFLLFFFAVVIVVIGVAGPFALQLIVLP